MKKPNVLVFSGYGLNCEEETKYAFELAGATADIIHINDLASQKKLLDEYQILALPGGFSYGDDTGSGNAFGNKLRNHLWEELYKYVAKDNLVIGICNGFQILSNLGLLPALENHYGERDTALVANNSARYTVRFVDLKVENDTPWFAKMKTFSVPIAHGEGKFYTSDKTLKILKKKHMIAAKYVIGDACNYLSYDANPNGSMEDISAITDESKRILGMMPHPERAMFFTQLPQWPVLKEQCVKEKKKLPKFGPGLQIFQNAVKYFN